MIICDCVNYIFRLQIVPTLLERISHIGVLMSYWLNHVVLSNTTQISKFVSRNLTQKRKKNNVKLNEKKSKTLDLLGMENWEKNYGICLSTHRPQRVLRYVQVIISINKMYTAHYKKLNANCTIILVLEIKPCGLGSRIRGMEADIMNIFDLHGGCKRPNTIQRAHTLAL